MEGLTVTRRAAPARGQGPPRVPGRGSAHRLEAEPCAKTEEAHGSGRGHRRGDPSEVRVGWIRLRVVVGRVVEQVLNVHAYLNVPRTREAEIPHEVQIGVGKARSAQPVDLEGKRTRLEAGWRPGIVGFEIRRVEPELRVVERPVGIQRNFRVALLDVVDVAVIEEVPETEQRSGL